MANTYHVEDKGFPAERTPDLGSWDAVLAECKRMNDLNEARHGRCFVAVERAPRDLVSGARTTLQRESA